MSEDVLVHVPCISDLEGVVGQNQEEKGRERTVEVEEKRKDSRLDLIRIKLEVIRFR